MWGLFLRLRHAEAKQATSKGLSTARDVELDLEANFINYGLVRFSHIRETSAEDPHTFSLTCPEDAEQAAWGI